MIWPRTSTHFPSFPSTRPRLSTRPAARCFLPPRGAAHSGWKLVWTLLLAVLLAPAFAAAQGGCHQGAGAAGSGEEERSGERARRPMGMLRRLRELTPMEQRRFMANNPQFLRLPPERQDLIRQRLRQWNAMTPQEKERVHEREEILAGLSPAQRQEARRIFPQWMDLTPGRRQAVMVAFRHLRDLPPGERRGFLDSQPVREQYSPHEREILEGLNKLLPTSGERPSEPPDD